VLIGIVQAVRLAWTSDDAYISFRYAGNLIAGNGLVFNAGERVEGYSNFLWTLWCAAGLRLGVRPESWAGAWGVVCYAISIALLGGIAWRHHEMAERHHAAAVRFVPLAALFAAFHRDWSIYATGGLETSMFTMLLLAGYALLAGPPPGTARLALGGAVFGLVALSRPDGLLFGGLAGLFLLVEHRGLRRGTLAFALALAAVVAPYAAWKLSYYGDLRPNTYYAKSAARAWYRQGAHYLLLYFRKYAVLLAALPLAAWVLRDRDPDPTGRRRSVALAALLAFGGTGYVMHVGGDFMFARFLIPVAPFYLVLIEQGWNQIAGRKPALYAAGALVALVALSVLPYPFQGEGWVHGIVNEHAYYSHERRDKAARQGEALRKAAEGLPVRMAFAGSEAALAWHSKVPLAIEAAAGLTDSFIARQPLPQRGRVGHEKQAPWDYLISMRRCQFLIGKSDLTTRNLEPWIPVLFARVDDLDLTLLTWDPPVMAEMRRRGARMDDFVELLDAYILVMPTLSDEEVRRDWPRFRRYYFDGVADPAREAPFRKRLGL
jgi:hypothetical protein